MKYYLYDEKTKQYVKEQEGYLDPLETKIQGKNVYLVPPFSTTEKPDLTSLKDNEILVFKGDKWQVKQEFYVGKIVDCQGERVSKYVTDNDLTFEKCDGGFKIVEKPLPKEKTLEELVRQRIDEIKVVVQNVLDAKAQELDYDDGFTLATYATSTKERYRNQANQFIAWRDNVWDKCYEILNAFQSGEIDMPTVDYVLERLPSLEWE